MLAACVCRCAASTLPLPSVWRFYQKNRDTMTLLSAGKGLIILVNPESQRRGRVVYACLEWQKEKKKKRKKEKEKGKKKAALKEVADDVLGERRIPGKAEFLSIK